MPTRNAPHVAALADRATDDVATPVQTSRWVCAILLLGSLTALSACDVTGVAAPSSAYAHSGEGLQYPGEPGYNAP